ncbi:MAG TPA: phosphotransferase, partial [Bacteroidales bacterium]|nr:phosphotransferase [Bacteroidales bacterium]
MEQLKILFEQFTGEQPLSIEELPSSGSNRRYFRIKGEKRSLIGAKGTCVDENIAFIKIADHFRKQGLNVPQVYNRSEDNIYYLQEDLGDDTLYRRITQGRESGKYSHQEKELLLKTIRKLPAIQFDGAKGLDFSVCYPQPEFDERMIFFDLNYFKYCFLKATGIQFSEIELQNDFDKVSQVLMHSMSDTFLYRDFQARNVMIVNDEPYFIDFQGGRKGPIFYDVASFIWQAKACYSENLKNELIDAYLDALQQYIPVDKREFRSTLRHFVLFRT